MGRLTGKVAIITGAGTGIGRATAIRFAREGATVVIADINAASGEETADLAGNGAIAIHTDVTDEASIQAAIQATVARFGALHVLHNNAGGSTLEDGTAVDAPIAEFWRVIKLDLFGMFLGCRFGIPAIIRSGGGSVINMSSNVALMGVPGRDCYTAAKGGVAAMTRSLAVEFAPQKVRVNAIAPSATMTERVRRLMAGNAAIDKLAKSHLLGLIEPTDIADMALFLASDEARMVTGQIYPVDSGVTISLKGTDMKIKRVEHIAIAVDSLRQSMDLLQNTFGIDVEYEEQIGQTRLAMLPVGETYLELLEGQGPESGVTKWIKEKGTGLFHICFEVEDIDGALAELKAKGVKLRDETPRIGHGGARIAFLDPASTGNVLIELAELAPGH